MKILGFKPGHDGSVVLIEDGQLPFSLEAEKDSNPRHADLTPALIVSALEKVGAVPDVVAIGGWHRNLPGIYRNEGAGYFGVQPGAFRAGRLLGHEVQFFTSTHERSHIMSAAAMAPQAPLRDCVVLVWEGVIGSFYHWRDYGRQITGHPVLSQPGTRYAALYALADPAFPDTAVEPRTVDAGKLMALAAYGNASHVQPAARATFRQLLAEPTLFPFAKTRYRDSVLYNVDVAAPQFADAAAAWSDLIFDTFAQAAARCLPAGLPLVIAGGCGLNCDWNSRWAENPQFTSVFVPPCADDSGSAIGTAVDAASALGAAPALQWSVYSGDSFVMDQSSRDLTGWSVQMADPDALADALCREQRVVAWVQGRWEIGPRALGHRSLLASAHEPAMRDRLNAIKRREPFRPIAPVVTAEQAKSLMHAPVLSDYMLFFARVNDPRLQAVTHVDGSARPQVLTASQEPALHRLLQAVGRHGSGVEALCNTSLNFSGRGFINRMSDLIAYADATAIDDLVVDGQWYQRRSPSAKVGP